jgi:hypothetical protein
MFPLVPAFLAGLVGGLFAMQWSDSVTASRAMIFLPAAIAYVAFGLLAYKRGVPRQGARIDT